MTALETLTKYGLKTDVKSVRERIKANEYQYIAQEVCDEHTPQSARLWGISSELRTADLSLLCSLAEKRERYEKAVKKAKEKVESERYTLANVDDDIEEINYYTGRKEMAEELLDEIITEAEGEGK